MIGQEKDWLAQEMKYEQKISAWDLDEPNKVKRMHQDNCPRRQLAKQHMDVHNANNQNGAIYTSHNSTSTKFNEKQIKRAQKFASLISTIFLLIVLVILFIDLFK